MLDVIKRPAMAREMLPRPTRRRVLIPKRGFHLPFCLSCLKPITTQAAMEGENRPREMWRRRFAAITAQAGSSHQESSDSPATVGATNRLPVPQPVTTVQASEPFEGTDSNRESMGVSDEHG